MSMFLRRSHIAIIHDLIMAALSFLIALYLRQGDGYSFNYPYVLQAGIIFTIISAVVFISMRLYSGLWRYASVSDLFQLTKAVTIVLLIFTIALFFYTRLEHFPRSAIIINWFVLLAMLGGPRFLYRNLKDNFAGKFIFVKNDTSKRAIPVLLVGTDPHAELFLRETKQKIYPTYEVVGIIDDNKKRKGSQVHGVQVLGTSDLLKKIISKLKEKSKARTRVVVSDAGEGALIRKLLRKVEALGLNLAKLPSLSDLKDGTEEVQVRAIAIEDLLGRAQRTPNVGRRKTFIEGKRILITGAGGTIGSELVRQLAKLQPASIVLYELSEFHLYNIEQCLKEQFPELKYQAIIGDVRDAKALENVFAKEKPQLVFHAAALKHVPIVENNVIEAVLTNVLGSKNVADACLKYKSEKMVMISTDKAVHPSSLMGVTKRVAEYYIQGVGAFNKKARTDFATVRFGNVLGSSGSVIPLFQKQLAAGGPITVTHPDMTRYFMTVPEAVELVLQASTLTSKESGEKSPIFVLDMGEPIRIKDLAEQMIQLSGKDDIEISYSGIRDGEKLYEELFYDFEEKSPTLYEDIQRAKAKEYDYDSTIEKLNHLIESCKIRDDKKVVTLLKALVPEYKKPEQDNKVA